MIQITKTSPGCIEINTAGTDFYCVEQVLPQVHNLLKDDPELQMLIQDKSLLIRVRQGANYLGCEFLENIKIKREKQKRQLPENITPFMVYNLACELGLDADVEQTYLPNPDNEKEFAVDSAGCLVPCIKVAFGTVIEKVKKFEKIIVPFFLDCECSQSKCTLYLSNYKVNE